MVGEGRGGWAFELLQCPQGGAAGDGGKWRWGRGALGAMQLPLEQRRSLCVCLRVRLHGPDGVRAQREGEGGGGAGVGRGAGFGARATPPRDT